MEGAIAGAGQARRQHELHRSQEQQMQRRSFEQRMQQLEQMERDAGASGSDGTSDSSPFVAANHDGTPTASSSNPASASGSGELGTAPAADSRGVGVLSIRTPISVPIDTAEEAPTRGMSKGGVLIDTPAVSEGRINRSDSWASMASFTDVGAGYVPEKKLPWLPIVDPALRGRGRLFALRYTVYNVLSLAPQECRVSHSKGRRTWPRALPDFRLRSTE